MLIIKTSRSDEQVASIGSGVPGALLVCGEARPHVRVPRSGTAPTGLKGRATRQSLWPEVVTFARPYPTSTPTRLVAVSAFGGHVITRVSAVVLRNLVPNGFDVPVGVGLRREPSNNAFQPPVRSAWGWSVEAQRSAAPRRLNASVRSYVGQWL